MSNPNVIYGNYGDELAVSGTKTHELGQRMVMPNGDSYAYAQCSSTATLAKGLLVTGAAIAWAETANVATASTGAHTITVTLGATASVTVKDLFEDGVFWVYKSTSAGEHYRIRKSGTAAAGSALTLNTFNSEPCSSALSAATCQIKTNNFKYVLLAAAATAQVGAIAGATAASCAVSDYIWLKRRGEIPITCSDTIGVVGARAIVSSSTAGNVARWIAAADTTTNSDVVGTFQALVATKGDRGLIYLTLD